MIQIAEESGIKLETVRQIRKAVLPLGYGQALDLCGAFRDMRGCDFKVSYEPGSGIGGLHINFENLSFCVYRNGTVMVYGMLNTNKQIEILTFFWHQHLCRFVVNNKATGNNIL